MDRRAGGRAVSRTGGLTDGRTDGWAVERADARQASGNWRGRRRQDKDPMNERSGPSISHGDPSVEVGPPAVVAGTAKREDQRSRRERGSVLGFEILTATPIGG